MKIRKNDTVLIISGKDRGKKGKILLASPKTKKVLVEGVNLRKKHQKPKKEGEKGQIVSMPAFIPLSNVKLLCPKCGKATRVGYTFLERNKVRVCKKCKQALE